MEKRRGEQSSGVTIEGIRKRKLIKQKHARKQPNTLIESPQIATDTAREQ